MKQNMGDSEVEVRPASRSLPDIDDLSDLIFGVGQLVLQGLKSAFAWSTESQGNYASLVYLRLRVLFQLDDYTEKGDLRREDFGAHFLQVSFIHFPKNFKTSVMRSSYMWPVLINVLILRHLLCWSPHHRSWLGRSSNAQRSVIVGQGHGQEFGRREVWDMWNILKPFFGGWYNMVSRCVISWISLIFPYISPVSRAQFPTMSPAGLGLAMLDLAWPQDKLLREAISNLESEHFCHYLMDHDSKSLALTYETVCWAQHEHFFLWKNKDLIIFDPYFQMNQYYHYNHI